MRFKPIFFPTTNFISLSAEEKKTFSIEMKIYKNSAKCMVIKFSVYLSDVVVVVVVAGIEIWYFTIRNMTFLPLDS